MQTRKSSNGIEQIAETFRLLGDLTRLSVLYELLEGGEKSVGRLAAQVDESQPNVSKHLKRLSRAGLVTRRKAGLQVYYRLADNRFGRLWRLFDGRQPSPGFKKQHLKRKSQRKFQTAA